MASFAAKVKPIANVLRRGGIGFIAGLIIAWFSLTYLGLIHGHNDLNQPELEREYRVRWMASGVAIVIAVLSMLAGERRISRIWLWFCIVFAGICVLPFWPHKDGSLLPLGTPYVNGGFSNSDAILLAIHASIALAIAVPIYWLWQMIWRRKPE